MRVAKFLRLFFNDPLHPPKISQPKIKNYSHVKSLANQK